MRNVRLILIAACAALIAQPAHAGRRWPAVPPEIGVAPTIVPIFTD